MNQINYKISGIIQLLEAYKNLLHASNESKNTIPQEEIINIQGRIRQLISSTIATL